MTLFTTTDRVTYQGNGTAVAFPFAFRIFAPTDLVVTLTTAAGVVTTLGLNTDYTVGWVLDDAAGSVAVTVPPAVGDTLEIRRELAIVQPLDITNQSKLYPDLIERELDYLTALNQQVGLQAANALQLSADGSTWNAAGLRIVSLDDGIGATDAVTVGQLELAVANLASGAGAFSPRIWTYVSSGGNVYSIPGGTLTRAESYIATWDGVVQPPDSYAVGTTSEPFSLVFNSLPPVGIDVTIRALAFSETLSSANIDASGVVSGVFNTARLGLGLASDMSFLRGDGTWSDTINGPISCTDLNFSGLLNGSADAALITTGIFPPVRLGTGAGSASTFLNGTGAFTVPAIATTTGFAVSDSNISPTVFTAIVLTGEQAGNVDKQIVDLYLDDTSGSGNAVLRGYASNVTPNNFGFVDGPSVLCQRQNSVDADMPEFVLANDNYDVFQRFEDQLQFTKIRLPSLATTGTASIGTYLRGDGEWAAPVASLGSAVATDPAGSTPAFPGTGAFYRADSQWANTITGGFYVQGSGGIPPILQIGTNVSEITLGAIQNSLEIPLSFGSWINVKAVGGGLLGGNDAADRLVVNGRARALRHRGEGAHMTRIQSTATSGTVTLDINAYGYFTTSPAGNITYAFTDGGVDPGSGSYATEFTVEISNPGANTITWPGNIVWGGGLAPTLASAGANIVRFTKRQGVANYAGALLVGGSSGAYTNEDAQDAVGTIFQASATITPTYSDGTPSMSWSVVNSSLSSAQIAPLGIATASLADGAVTNVKVASGTLSLDRLSATGLRDGTTVLWGDNTWRAPPSGGGGGQAAIQFRDESNTVGGLGAIQTVNFTGSGVTATAVGTTLTVGIAGGGTIFYEDDGFAVGDSASRPTISFGTNLSVSLGAGNRIIVNATGGGGGGGQAPVQFQDEGVAVGGLGTVTSFNVVGNGATLSAVGTALTLTVPGGGGGGGGGSSIVFNVRDYGAVGNGVADDTGSIQSAIAAASSAGGGIVVLPAGTYITSGGLTVPTKVAVVGSGTSATTLKLKNATSGSADILRATGNYVQFADFTIDGNASNNPTIQRAGLSFADSTNNHRSTNVQVLNNRGFGYAFNSCTDMLFDNCRAVGTKKKQGFWMGSLSGRSARITFLNCHAISSDWDGIHVHGDQIEIIGGYWNQNGQDVSDIGTFGACGIYVDPAFPCVDVSVTGAVANDNKETGIQLCGQGMIVSNCIARRNWAAGINLNANRGIVTGCFSEGNGLVRTNGPSFWTDPGNPYRFVYSGICSLSSSEIIFTGNRCNDLKGSKTQKYGISAETAATGTNTDYLRLTGNMLHGNTNDTGVETATNVTIV